MDLVAVITTVADDAQARALADAALQQRLAACVQAERIHSSYRWQGAVQHEPEQRLVFKTTRAAAPRLLQLLQALHSYSLPALYTVPVLDATPAYAAWVAQEVTREVTNESTQEALPPTGSAGTSACG